MRVLVLSQYYAPELTAGAWRVSTFCRRLAATGVDVEVICEIPNHPRGVVEEGYGRKAFDRRQVDGVHVNYAWVPARPVKTTWNRVAAYGVYAVMATIAGALARRPDIVFASSPPLPVGVAASMAARRHRRPWVLDVRDLWPAAAVAVGELRGDRLVALATRLEHRLYHSADAITTPSERAREEIVKTGVPAERIHFVPTGTTREWLDLGRKVLDREPLHLPRDRFIWTYAGNLGLAQDLHTAIRAAARLGLEYQLVVVGDGPLRSELEALAQRLATKSVRFTGLVPAATAGEYMRASDALLVPLADAPGLDYAVPSKLFDCCATGRPVIVAARGEAQRVAIAHGIALAIEPGNADALAAAVRRLRHDRALCDRLAASARAFAERNSTETQADELAAILASVLR
jgi:colanic acid biosynthesis glycosyl transferase WcaI